MLTTQWARRDPARKEWGGQSMPVRGAGSDKPFFPDGTVSPLRDGPSPPDTRVVLSLAPEVPAVSPEQAAVMADAAAGLRRVRRAAGVARFSGGTLLVFALITAIGGLSDPFAMGVAVVLGILAWSEFQGARGVQFLRPAASRRLVANQCVLLGLILVYSGVSIVRILMADAPPGMEATGDPQVDRMMNEVGGLVTTISLAVYAAVAAIGVPVQILMAVYHARRGRQLAESLAKTPGWAVDVARAA